jgi:hypothetical protein
MFKDVHIKQIFPRLFHIEFPNQYIITSTFMRMQEFYESPYENIKGNYFSLEEFMDTYAEHQGNFTYTTDWNGFNVPGNIVVEFFEVFGYRMLNKEIKFLNLLRDNIDKKFLTTNKKFYLIGSVANNKVTMNHEIAHGLFYLNEDYRKETLKLNAEKDLAGYKKDLLNMGYCEEVLDDEIQAFFATSDEQHMKGVFETTDVDLNIQKPYKILFQKTISECGGI